MSPLHDEAPLRTSSEEPPRPRESIMGIRRYAAGRRATDDPRAEPIKLSSNESSFGPCPGAVAAYHDAARELHRYPDPSQGELREAIAEVHGLDPSRIVCGNGSDELIDLLIRAFVQPGEELLLTENHFEMCSVHGHTQGADIVLAPERAFRVDVDALLARVSATTRMVILANPNNPTGTYLTAPEVRGLHAGLPAGVMLVLDAAYAEYVVEVDYDAGMELVGAHDNVVVTRTFSKIYGLSALRVGWAYCPPAVVDVLERVRSPFNVNAAALAAAAAAVRDQAHIEVVRRHNAVWLRRIRDALADLGVEVVPSVTNFYLVRFDAARGHTAADAARFLESRGIIPRAVGASETENVLRITVGKDHENEAVVDALKAYVS